MNSLKTQDRKGLDKFGCALLFLMLAQYGITWYFDGEHEVGQYANGDWWVLGPVTITRITPESVEVNGRWINGTQVNPSQGHGLDSQGYDSSVSMGYSSSLNRAPSVSGPLPLTTGSVVSGLSGAPASANSSSNGPALDELSILTVVSEVPPIGAFRPHPYGTDKTSYWTESKLDYSILQSLSPPSGVTVPNIDSAVNSQKRFWNEQAGWSWKQGGVKSRSAQGTGYGRDNARALGDRGLMLHLNYSNAEKRDLFVALVQYGIDIHGRILTGGTWSANGGINHGRKLPLLLAGIALGAEDILYWANRENTGGVGQGYGYNLFQEDGTTAYLTQADITNNGYPQNQLGLPEWGLRYWQYFSGSTGASDNLYPWPSGSYRWVGSQYVAHALVVRLFAERDSVGIWNWPPFFGYTDRFQQYPAVWSVGSTNGVSEFSQAMWDAYREYAGNQEKVAPPKPPSVSVD
jgi:hypothetical protein